MICYKILGNGLITPGHVHVLGILRGARENHTKCGAPAEPTGNPHLDMQQQRQQERYVYIFKTSKMRADNTFLLIWLSIIKYLYEVILQ